MITIILLLLVLSLLLLSLSITIYYQFLTFSPIFFVLGTTCMRTSLSVCLSVQCLPVCRSVSQSVSLSVCLSICKSCPSAVRRLFVSSEYSISSLSLPFFRTTNPSCVLVVLMRTYCDKFRYTANSLLYCFLRRHVGHRLRMCAR